MKMIPSALAAFMLAACFCSAGITAAAEEEARIYGSVAADDGSDEKYVQVYIENNPGIMGCRLIFEYPEESLEVLSAHSGEVTKSGMFLDNIGDCEGSFDILWNNTEDVTADGTFVILEVRQLTDKPYEIGISFSQEDTFNESWEDVHLVCENISSGIQSGDAPAVIEEELQENLADELMTDIYELDSEQTPGAVIESYLQKNGEKVLTEDNVSGLQEVFKSEGLDAVYSERLTDKELAEVYSKIYEDYSGKTAAAAKNVGYEPAVWIYIAVPIAAAGIIIVLHRRMKNREKQK